MNYRLAGCTFAVFAFLTYAVTGLSLQRVNILDLSNRHVPYERALGWQHGLVEHHIRTKDTLIQAKAVQIDTEGTVGSVLVLQHYPVYTLGSGTTPNSGPFRKACSDGNLLPYETVKVDRAGEATFHGPGQIVLYPVLDLVSCDAFYTVTCSLVVWSFATKLTNYLCYKPLLLCYKNFIKHVCFAVFLFAIVLLWKRYKLLSAKSGRNGNPSCAGIRDQRRSHRAAWLHGCVGRKEQGGGHRREDPQVGHHARRVGERGPRHALLREYCAVRDHGRGQVRGVSATVQR
jgi:hypothetical protein